MRFAVLGSLQVIVGDADEAGTVSATRLRVLLAVLLWRETSRYRPMNSPS